MNNRIKRLGEGYLSLWNSAKGWKLFLLYTLHYTAVFFILWNTMYAPFAEAEVSFMNTMDSVEAHFPRLIYISQTIRQGIKALLSGEGWTFPMYDFRTGLVAQDLQIGFPQILAIFWPSNRIDEFYQFYVPFIYYLIGLSFSYFGFFFKQKPLPVLTGAIAYAFCGYTLYAGVLHPHFIVPLMYLPLLIVGAEKVLRKEKAYILLATVFLSLTTQWGLYFSCIQAILVVIYSCVRFFDIYEDNRIREAVRFVGRLCVWGGTGALLAMFVAIPSLLSILGIDRVGRDISAFTNMFSYPEEYYEAFLANFTMIPGNMANWTCLGFSVLTVPAVFLLFARKEKAERSLKLLFVILTVMLCIPYLGYIMSGFSSVSNRFCFGYAFCAAAILMFMIPKFSQATRSQMVLTGILMIVYIALCRFGVSKQFYQEAPLVMLALAALVFLLCKVGGKRWVSAVTLISMLITCFSVCHSAYLLYDPEQRDFVSQYVEDPYAYMEESQYQVLSENQQISEDDDFFRVAGSYIRRGDSNTAFYYDLNGISMYPYFGWSSAYMDWVSETEVARYGNKHVLLGLNSHPAMLTLAGCKYYVLRAGYAHPYGFSEIGRVETEETTDVILKNDHWLPIGYTYDQYISREQYDALDALGKQEAQLQAVVLEEAPGLTAIGESNVTTTATKVPYKVVRMDGVTWEDGILTVEEDGASMRLSIEAKPYSTTYLRMVNLDLTDGDSATNWTLSAYDEGTAAKAYFQADGYEYSTGQYTQMLDLGYSAGGTSVIRIRFPSAGTYKLEDIQLWCQPMQSYKGYVEKLNQEVLENVETDWHSLRGTISVSQDKMLCLALPWLDGWTAYVDGEEVALHRANTAFMAVELPAGDHTVELRYWLPGLTLGLILSGIGAVCLICIIATHKREKKR